MPTSTPPGRQEYWIAEANVKLRAPDSTALGGTPGSPQEMAAETTTDWDADTGGGISDLLWMVQLGHRGRRRGGEGDRERGAGGGAEER